MEEITGILYIGRKRRMGLERGGILWQNRRSWNKAKKKHVR